MEESQATKSDIRKLIADNLAALPEEDLAAKTKQIEERLFEFANFLEAKIVLLYMNSSGEARSRDIVKRCFDYNKIVVLPAFDAHKHQMTLMKVSNLATDLKMGPRGVPEPDAGRCKTVPIDRIDLAVIPGRAFDEKGGRIGSGQGYYDRFIPKLAITTRKVALSLEAQMIPQVQMESHDRHVDIIITENRVIYKI